MNDRQGQGHGQQDQRDRRDQRDQRPREEYKVDKTFEDPDGSGLVVQVNKLAIRPPQFSYVIGMWRSTREGTKIISRFIPAKFFGQGTINVVNTAGVLEDLMRLAQEYAHSERQIAEDIWVEKSIEYGERKDNWGKPEPKKGISGGPNSGKTQKRREAKRGVRTGQGAAT